MNNSGVTVQLECRCGRKFEFTDCDYLGGDRTLPNGWLLMEGYLLCDQCSNEVRKYIAAIWRGRPKQ